MRFDGGGSEAAPALGNVRQWRRCTRTEAWPYTGQVASAAIAIVAITELAASSVKLSTCRPAGAVGRNGFEIDTGRVFGHHPLINVPTNQIDSALPAVRMNPNGYPVRNPARMRKAIACGEIRRTAQTPILAAEGVPLGEQAGYPWRREQFSPSRRRTTPRRHPREEVTMSETTADKRYPAAG